MGTRFDRFLEDIFVRENICCYAVMPFEACRVINSRLLDKLTFAPRTAIIFLVPYLSTETENISCYASGGDYHHYTSEFFRMNTPFLKFHSSGYHFAGFCDHSPIDERHAAATAGLGVIGDNGLLINPDYGSYVFIAEWLTDMPTDSFTCVTPKEIEGCEHCGACARACPSGNLPNFSKRRCVSAMTQKKSALTEEEEELIKKNGSVWGCDTCQTVCPYNIRAIGIDHGTPVQWFKRYQIPCMTSEILSHMSDEEFALRAYSYRKREVLERNLKLLGY